jgi:hypothetical protein
VFQFVVGVCFKLVGNVHVFRALEHLRIDDVRDDRLILTREVFVEQFGKTLPCDLLVRFFFDVGSFICVPR